MQGVSSLPDDDVRTPSLLGPIPETERLDPIDVTRGVAVLGILLLNIVSMGLPYPAYSDPSGYGGDTGWNLRVWLLNNLWVEGTMRTLFSMLFGAGVVLFCAKGGDKSPGVALADAWYRRTIWLFIFGMLHAYVLLWSGDILYSYGLMGMFLFPLRNIKPGRLFLLGAALLLAGVTVNLVDNVHSIHLHTSADAAQAARKQGQTLSKAQLKDIDDWDAKVRELQPDLDTKREVVAKMQGGYFSALKQSAETTYLYESEFHYRYDYFDVLSVMIIGMALFKWRLFHTELPYKAYAFMVFLGYGIGLPVNWYESFTYIRQHFSVVAAYQTNNTYDLGRLAMTTGHLGLIMLFCKSGTLPWLRRRLAAVGRMALTNYVVQTVITTTIFVGFAQFGKWQRYELYFIVFGIWLFQLVVSPIWFKHFPFGPLEWLWRGLTYLRRQPFRRKLPFAPSPRC